MIINARKQPGMDEDVAEFSIARAFGSDVRNKLDIVTVYYPGGYVLRSKK